MYTGTQTRLQEYLLCGIKRKLFYSSHRVTKVPKTCSKIRMCIGQDSLAVSSWLSWLNEITDSQMSSVWLTIVINTDCKVWWRWVQNPCVAIMSRPWLIFKIFWGSRGIKITYLRDFLGLGGKSVRLITKYSYRVYDRKNHSRVLIIMANNNRYLYDMCFFKTTCLET